MELLKQSTGLVCNCDWKSKQKQNKYAAKMNRKEIESIGIDKCYDMIFKAVPFRITK